MLTVTVTLDRKRGARLARWPRLRKAPKSEIIRELIVRAGPIESADDLIEWVEQGKGLGLTPGAQ